MQVKKTVKIIVCPGIFDEINPYTINVPSKMLISHRIYVWHMYPHLTHKNVGKYSIHTWIRNGYEFSGPTFKDSLEFICFFPSKVTM